jgi:hypothetical protein
MLSVYGRDAESRIADPADPGRVFSWLLCQVRDTATGCRCSTIPASGRWT